MHSFNGYTQWAVVDVNVIQRREKATTHRGKIATITIMTCPPKQVKSFVIRHQSNHLHHSTTQDPTRTDGRQVRCHRVVFARSVRDTLTYTKSHRQYSHVQVCIACKAGESNLHSLVVPRTR